jgi:hypothetical protein
MNGLCDSLIADLNDTTCAGKFCINHETGELSLGEMLDTETQPVHTVPLAISNQRQLQYDVRIPPNTRYRTRDGCIQTSKA